jgi:DNA polymerase III epsilon subunit-like protein
VIVTIDFETYHDKDYSLRKLSTSEYIRDRRFEAICASIKRGDGKTHVFWGKDAIQAELDRVDWRKHELLAHHAHFEGLILSHHFGVVPVKYRDTLSMGRALFPKSERNDLGSLAERLGVQNKLVMPDFKGRHLADFDAALRKDVSAYVAGDTESCAQSYVAMVQDFPEAELELIDITVRMFAHPVLRLDMKVAKAELAREAQERQDAIAGSKALETALQLATDKVLELPKVKKGEVLTDERVLSSNKTFPELLRQAGVEPPIKKSKTTGKDTYALAKSDEAFTDLIAHPEPRVVALVRARLAAKSTIGETRAARLIRSGSGRKALPVYLNYCGAHTTRWSGGDKLNYQNLKNKGKIKNAILPPPGQKLIRIDSAQIEARVTAWLAGETWVLEAFRQMRDIYSEFASTVYNRVITKADKLERFVGKTCVLGLGFQMGGPKLQKTILNQSINQGLAPVRLELDVCYNLVSIYRQKCAKIEALWEFFQHTMLAELATMGLGEEREYKAIKWGREYIKLPNGLKLHYPDVRVSFQNKKRWGQKVAEARVVDASYLTVEGRTKLYGGIITENIVQALARVIVAEQMLKIAERYRIVMMTHDEIVFLAPAKEADEALAFGLKIMKTPPAWAPDLPVSAEGAHDVRYGK